MDDATTADALRDELAAAVAACDAADEALSQSSIRMRSAEAREPLIDALSAAQARVGSAQFALDRAIEFTASAAEAVNAEGVSRGAAADAPGAVDTTDEIARAESAALAGDDESSVEAEA